MRKAEIRRETKETSIYCQMNLDGNGIHEINTGIGFFSLNALLTLWRILLI